MLDVNEQIVAKLKNILPTYYELFTDGSTPMPCITYMEDFNKDNLTGDTFGYSDIGYIIKIWDTSIDTIQAKAKRVDAAMRSMGFKRVNSLELSAYNQIEKVLYYQALGKESY